MKVKDLKELLERVDEKGGGVMNENEPRPIGEVIKDLIESGEILPNLKSRKYGKR